MSQPLRYPGEPAWYVVYVRSRTEKKVAERMERDGISHYLPLLRTKRQWSDRVKEVDMPLFPGYLFVQTTATDFSTVQVVPGVVGFVREEGRNAVVPTDQIEAVRDFLTTGQIQGAQPDDFAPGERVRVIHGPLFGVEGELVELRNEKHFIIRVEVIQQVILADLPPGYLERIPQN